MTYDLEPKESYTRAIRTPDGDNLITLTGDFWNSLDYLNAQTVWSESRILQVAWTSAKQMQNDGTMTFDSFQLELTAALKMVIGYRVNWIEHLGDDVANDR